MSIKAVSWALDQPIGGNLKLVLIALADSHSDDRGCFPSRETLLKKAHISKATYKRVIGQLEDAGYVTRAERFTETGRRTSNEFTLHMGVGAQPDTHVGAQVDTGVGAQPDTGVGLTADTHLTVNSKSNGKGNGADVILNSSAWQEWLTHRKELRKPMTPSTQKKQLRDLMKFQETGITPESVIDHSIAKGWTGLFAPDAKRGNGSVAAHNRAAVDEFLGYEDLLGANVDEQ